MRYGMVCAGPVNEYLADKLPGLIRELGPVAATTYRSASRIVNTLGAGTALRTMDDLASTKLVLICAPGEHLDSVLPLLQRSSVNWARKAILLCNCRAFSRDLEYFRKLGASVASVSSLAVLPGRYLVEGDRLALRAARYIVRQLRGIPVEIESRHADLFLAAQTFSTSLFTPLVHACMTALKAAGITGSLQSQILEASFQHQLRMYLYSGRKSWTGTVASGDPSEIDRELAILHHLQPELADLYRSIAAPAADLLKYRRAGTQSDPETA